MSLGRTIFLTLAAALLGTASLSAQDPTGTVSGRVVESATQEPVPGAAVSVAARNAVSGQDGRFTITGVPAGTHTVQATRIGYGQASQQVSVSAGQTATVTLALGSQALLLEGVVAIGYGERQVRDVTGAVQGVAAEDFNTGRVVSAEQLIQGKVAGVQISDNGEPGGTNNIRIRGGTSLTASSEPLFVIDGVPIAAGGGLSAGRNPLNFLNPDDIERVTVLASGPSTSSRSSAGTRMPTAIARPPIRGIGCLWTRGRSRSGTSYAPRRIATRATIGVSRIVIASEASSPVRPTKPTLPVVFTFIPFRVSFSHRGPAAPHQGPPTRSRSSGKWRAGRPPRADRRAGTPCRSG